MSTIPKSSLSPVLHYRHQPCLPVVRWSQGDFPLSCLTHQDAGMAVRQQMDRILRIGHFIGTSANSLKATAAALTPTNSPGPVYEMLDRPPRLDLSKATVDPDVLVKVKTWWMTPTSYDVVLAMDRKGKKGSSSEGATNKTPLHWGRVNTAQPGRIHINYNRLIQPMMACLDRADDQTLPELDRRIAQHSYEAFMVMSVYTFLHESQHSIRYSLFPETISPANLHSPMTESWKKECIGTGMNRLQVGEGGEWWTWAVFGARLYLFDVDEEDGEERNVNVSLVAEIGKRSWFVISPSTLDVLLAADNHEAIAAILPLKPGDKLIKKSKPRTCHSYVEEPFTYDDNEYPVGPRYTNDADELSVPQRGRGEPLVPSPILRHERQVESDEDSEEYDGNGLARMCILERH